MSEAAGRAYRPRRRGAEAPAGTPWGAGERSDQETQGEAAGRAGERSDHKTQSDVVACPSCGKKNRVPAAANGLPRCANCHKPLPWLTNAGDVDFDTVAGGSPVPVLVDLWAPWCGPCRTVAPGVEQAARTLAGRLKVVKVNVDEAPAIAARYRATSIPMLLLLDRGKVVDKKVGALPPDALLRWVQAAA